MKINRHRAVAAGAFIRVAAGVAAPAVAEGGFDSYMTDWREGKESRTWDDGNLDSTNGFVQFANCELYVSDFKITVYKEDWGPDTAIESGWIDFCPSSPKPPGGWPRIYFGDVSKAKYHFTLKDVQAPDPTVTVDNLRVRY